MSSNQYSQNKPYPIPMMTQNASGVLLLTGQMIHSLSFQKGYSGIAGCKAMNLMFMTGLTFPFEPVNVPSTLCSGVYVFCWSKHQT
jgi:hypothetical protein